MRVVIVGASMTGSHADGRVQEAIRSGWETVCGEGNVFSAPLTSASPVIRHLQPALALCCGSYGPETAYYGELSAACRSVGARSIFWATEDPCHIDASYRVAGRFDHVFTCDKNASSFFSRGSVAHHLPMAGARRLHYRPLVPYSERRIDIFFHGEASHLRRELIEGILPTLRRHHVLIKGPGWGRFGDASHPGQFADERIDGDALIDCYANSRLVLNIGRTSHAENMRFKLAPSTPGAGTFEAAMAGTCQLVMEDSWDIREMFAADEVMTFTSMIDLEEAIGRCMDDPAACERMASKGQRRALADHTYERRARRILDVVAMEKAL